MIETEYEAPEGIDAAAVARAKYHLPADQHVMTEDEARAFLGMSKSAFAALRRAGGGPAFKQISRTLRLYIRADLVNWVRAFVPA